MLPERRGPRREAADHAGTKKGNVMARPGEILSAILITVAICGLLGLVVLHARGDKPLLASTTRPAAPAVGSAAMTAEAPKSADQQKAAENAAPAKNEADVEGSGGSKTAANDAAPPAKDASPAAEARETAPAGGGAAAPQANTTAPDTTKPAAPQSAAGSGGKTAASDGSGKAADQAAAQQGGGDKAASADTGGSPVETAKSAEKGSLKSPYSDFKQVADEGHKKFMSAGCNGCHGGGGGGGMGPPLTNQIWVYGKDDDTLFRLVALGSDELQKQGFTRKGSEHVVGPMPQMGTVVKSNDDLWKIIAWIRSVNPSSAEGSPAASAAPGTSSPQ
jgi:hypothetical protein